MSDHDNALAELEPAPEARPYKLVYKSRKQPPKIQTEEMTMAWTTPVIVEVCVGMEVTSYSSAEI
ncbi:MAG: pyrroloquinoline quinone precursor peptide PqqA [Methylocystis sp.]|jgi:coenzyme PQQ precursor peptide PqqA